MQFNRYALLLLGAVLPLVVPAPVNLESRAPQAIPGKYIVVLKETLSSNKIAAHRQWASDIHARSLERRDPQAGEAPAGIEKEYSINKFNGYAGSFDKATIEEIKASDDV